MIPKSEMHGDFDYSECLVHKWPALTDKELEIEQRLLKGVARFADSRKTKAAIHRDIRFALVKSR